nr:hypothetical protein CFP56_54935 [Quercus suber]
MSFPPPKAMSPPATTKPAPPRPYPPYQASASPTNASPYAPPPAKRQRLSPDVRSPPNGHTSAFHPPPHGIPVGAYGNPYAQSQLPQSPYGSSTFAGSPPSSFHTPQPYPVPQNQWSHASNSSNGRQGSPTNSQMQNAQMMPPPPRPIKEEREERLNAEDLGDSLFASGINLKDEENYMHSTFNNRHGAYDSFASNQSTSFGSNTPSANNSFNLLAQTTGSGSQGGSDGAFAGTMGQTATEDIEVQLRRKRALAASQRNEHLQLPLNNQFLQANCVRRRLDRSAYESGVRLPTEGLYVRSNEAQPENSANGEQKSRPESMVEQGSQFDLLLSLVNLAAGERLRGLLDEAYALARARRYGDHGRVPPDFMDIAEGEGKQRSEEVVPENITGTQWDRLPDPMDLTQDGAAVNGAGHDSATPQPQRTISFQGKLNAHLRKLAQAEREAEKERIKKREARRKAAEAGSGEGGLVGDASAAEVPIEPTAPAKISKKEEAKAKKANNEVSNLQVNATVAHAIGGKRSQKYSWMSQGGGTANLTANKFKAAPSAASSTAASGTATPVKTAPGSANSPVGPLTTAKPTVSTSVRAPEWGDWREDGPGGKGIQARDWALVLERDGREKKALQRTLNRLT